MHCTLWVWVVLLRWHILPRIGSLWVQQNLPWATTSWHTQPSVPALMCQIKRPDRNLWGEWKLSRPNTGYCVYTWLFQNWCEHYPWYVSPSSEDIKSQKKKDASRTPFGSGVGLSVVCVPLYITCCLSCHFLCGWPILLTFIFLFLLFFSRKFFGIFCYRYGLFVFCVWLLLSS